MESNNPTTVTSTPKAQAVPTMKLICNKTHVGPVRDSKHDKFERLSAAANKIRLDNDLKIRMVSDEKPVKASSKSPNQSVEITISGRPISAANAVILAEAWSQVYDAPGTERYLEKSVLLEKAKNEAYTEMGFSNTDKKLTLTEEQRMMYNAKVGPYAFDYYEVRLSYKVPGKKSVRTKTYRMLEQPDMNAIQRKIMTRAKAISAELKIELSSASESH